MSLTRPRRKRPLVVALAWRQHRELQSTLAAIAAMKRAWRQWKKERRQ